MAPSWPAIPIARAPAGGLARVSDGGRWRPTGVDDLEPAAWDALQSATHAFVVAGPGAGKTELLAQRAAYLLQTGAAPDPRRVLAISFKKDAAAVLRDRVRDRVGPAARFDSYTFDAFARGLVERFRHALPHGLRPPAAYELAASHDDRVRGRVRDAVRALRATTPARVLPPAHRGVEHDDPFVRDVLAGDALPDASANATGAGRGGSAAAGGALTWATAPIWAALVGAVPCALTFDMVKRMAERLVTGNPRVAAALRATYSHVFLDEFQDVTPLQYELLYACFPPAGVSPRVRPDGAVLTAVGDDKQRIMGWAGALSDGFARFAGDYGAGRRTLLMNYRSDAELVRIQRTLVAALDGACPPPVPAPANEAGTGRCEVLAFGSDAAEAEHVAARVEALVAGRDAPYGPVAPRDVCLLARMRPDSYAAAVQAALAARGIASRLEDPYDDLLRDEVVRAVLRVLRLAAGGGGHADYTATRDLVLVLAGAEEDGPRARALEEDLGRRLEALRSDLVAAPPAGGGAERAVRRVLDGVFGGSPRLRGAFPHARNDAEYQTTMRALADRLAESGVRAPGWAPALADLAGERAVPIMSAHKSKGLQFHTVVLIGLEDEAWTWSGDLSHEDKCLFFVAFSRARQQVLFTYAAHRRRGGQGAPRPQGRERVSALYDLLRDAGVPVREC